MPVAAQCRRRGQWSTGFRSAESPYTTSSLPSSMPHLAKMMTLPSSAISGLQRLPVRIDFDRQQITFYNPRYFNPPSKEPFIAVHFEENSVVGEASVDGIPALLLIDTGSIHSLFLNSPFVKEHDLVHRYSATIRGYAGEGYG